MKNINEINNKATNKANTNKLLSVFALIINLLYISGVIAIKTGTFNTGTVFIVTITAYIYFLFLTAKNIYATIKRDKSVYNVGVTDCLFILATLYYVSVGLIGNIAIMLLTLKIFEMLMYVNMQKYPIKNGSRKGDK